MQLRDAACRWPRGDAGANLRTMDVPKHAHVAALHRNALTSGQRSLFRLDQ
jgi:hypothetical protein